jgi:hypothetical protein
MGCLPGLLTEIFKILHLVTHGSECLQNCFWRLETVGGSESHYQGDPEMQVLGYKENTLLQCECVALPSSIS